MFEDGILSSVGTLLAVILILYLAFVCTRYIGKTGKIKGSSRYIRLVDQIAVGQDRTIAVIQTGASYLLLGITSSKITVLKELDAEELKEIGNNPAEDMQFPDFKTMMDKIGKRKRKE